MSIRTSVCIALAIVAASSGAAAQLAAGFESDTIPAAPGSAFVGGFEVLRNGNYAVHDGAHVREISAVDGSTVRILYPASVFGAFLKLHPTKDVLYFAESSSGKVLAIDLGSRAVELVASVQFPYDLAIDPQGRVFVSWSLGFGLPSVVSEIVHGKLVDVLVANAPSGPIEFDAAGNLWYAEPFPDFPPDPEATPLYRFQSTQLDAARQTYLPLAPEDGQLITVLDGAFDIVCDDNGDTFVTDPFFDKVVEVDGETHAERIVFQGSAPGGVSFARFLPGNTGPFEWFQPPGSGELACLRSDFFNFNDVLRIRPRRPVLSTPDPLPLAQGPYELDLDGGVRNGVAWLWITSGVAAVETPLGNPTWTAPLWWGLDLSQGPVLSTFLPADAGGRFTLSLHNPGAPGLVLGLQAIVGESAAGPFYGTSNALELEYQ